MLKKQEKTAFFRYGKWTGCGSLTAQDSGRKIGSEQSFPPTELRRPTREKEMNFKKPLAGAISGIAMLAGAQAMAADEITVAYFLEWPMPFQYAKAMGTYEEEMGVTINWRSFDTGTAMSAAMASGDVQISVSQGVPPFVVAASAGQDIQIVDVAVSYSENDNCVVASALEIDKESAGELAGKKVAVPIGTAAHYGFLKQMAHFGVDTGSLEIVDMAPAEGAAALAQGSLDMACG